MYIRNTVCLILLCQLVIFHIFGFTFFLNFFLHFRWREGGVGGISLKVFLKRGKVDYHNRTCQNFAVAPGSNKRNFLKLPYRADSFPKLTLYQI